jgi:hypothetical protein
MDTADEDSIERAWREKQEEQEQEVRKAFAILEKSLDFPSTQVRIHEQEQAFEQSKAGVLTERLSAQRLEESLRLLDIHCESYLLLVVDLESEKAFATVVADYVLPQVWSYFGGGFPMEMIPPTPSFAAPGTIPLQLHRDKLRNRARHWVVEGYRRLAGITKAKPVQQGVPPAASRHRTQLEPKPEKLSNIDSTLSRIGAADALGITPRTLDRWVRDKKLTPVGFGHSKRFKARDLKKLLDQKILDKRDNK